MLSKNLTIFLALILFLAAGFGAGYYFGISANPKTASVGDNCLNKTGGNGARSEIKTELTAGEARKIALREAGQWAADAYLSEINLASSKFGSDGSSNGWKLVFYSKAKNKLYEILIKDGESRLGEEKMADAKKAPQALKGEMADSAVLAKSFFGSYPADTEIISLKMYYDAGAKKFLWTIFFPRGSHTIDAEI